MSISDYEPKLEHLFWLGGSPCAGKSSISEILASRFDLALYHVDEAFEVHAQRFDSLLHPNLTTWFSSSWNQRWMRPIDRLLQDAIACYGEHFTLVLEDILSMPRDNLCWLKGQLHWARQVAGMLAERNRAIWMVATADFQREYYSKREWTHEIPVRCENSEEAFNNWMERDAEFAHWVTAEVKALGLELLQVDGKHTVEENAMKVATHFQLTAAVPHI